MAETPKVQALLMAGGQGERLYPLTASRPKPAVPFGGVFRIVDFTLSNCLNSGLSHVSLLTQYKHEELHSYIQESWSGLWSGRTGETLECLPPDRGNRYRGTADAVFQNMDALRRRSPELVLILSADHVYQMDYRKLLRFHAETNADVTIATVEHSLTAAKHFGVVEADSDRRLVTFQEKPSLRSHSAGALINMGVYAFKTAVLVQALSENCDRQNRYDFGHHIIPSLIGSAQIRAYDFRDETKGAPCYWRDIGTLDSYYETNMDLLRPEKRFDPYASKDWPSYPVCFPRLPLNSRLRTNCRVTRSILSPGVHVEDGCSIESSVLMPGVRVGRDTRIRRAIIEENVHIPSGFQIGFNLVNDSKHYFVTDAGVVVVSRMPKQTRPVLVGLPARRRRLARSNPTPPEILLWR